MKALLASAVLLSGCSSIPEIAGQGAYTCVRVETLTTTTTTVYVSASQGGTVLVHPDCSALLKLESRGVAL